MAKRTSLYDRHVALGGRLVDFSGWILPVQYEGVLSEHRHCRASAVAFDTSHMGQFLFRGPGVAEALAGVCTQNAPALSVGACRYGFLLNEDAGVLDDTVLMRLAEAEFLLVVNAGTQDDDWQWMGRHLPDGLDRESLSAKGWGKIDLQGPASSAVLAPLTDIDPAAMPYYGVARGRCCERDCILSRTGYTGELGYEIMAAGEDLPAILDRLLADDRARPAGLGARDSLRLEMGYPLYGHELSPARTPLEAGLIRFAKTEHGFPGAGRLRELAAAPPARRLVALQAESRRRTSPGDEILSAGRSVGAVTSGAFSPSLEVSIALGYVAADASQTGAELTVRTARAELPVRVVETPFYRQGTCRAKPRP